MQQRIQGDNNNNLFFSQEAFTAFHPDKKVVTKYLKPLCIGHIPKEHQKQVGIPKGLINIYSGWGGGINI